MTVEIIQPYTSQYPEPISFEAGATVKVERGDDEYPGWFWCRLPAGNAGWVHHSFLSASAGTTTAARPYSARELTVAAGERGELIHSLDGWAFLRLNRGDEGWIPEKHIRQVTDE